MVNEHVIKFFTDIHGPHASMVSILDIDNRGYYTYITNANGAYLVLNGEYLREFNPWPDPGNWVTFLRAAEADMEAAAARG